MRPRNWSSGLLAVLVALLFFAAAANEAIENNIMRVQGCEGRDFRECCLFDEVAIEFQFEILKVAGVYAVWGLAVKDEDSGQLLRRADLSSGKLKITNDSYAGMEPGMVSWESQREILASKLANFQTMIPAVGCETIDVWESEIEGSCGDGGHWPKLLRAQIDGENRYVFDFDRNTNRPPVQTHDEVLAVLAFSMPLGERLRGEWLSPSRLLVEVLEVLNDDVEVDEDVKEDRNQNQEPKTFSVHVRQYPREDEKAARWALTHGAPGSNAIFAGRHRLRIGYEANIRLQIFAHNLSSPVVESEVISFKDCQNRRDGGSGLDILIRRPNILVSDDEEKTSPQATVRKPPVLVMKDTMVFFESNLQLPRLLGEQPLSHWSDVFYQSEWTLSFWIAVDPRQSQDSLRSLLYHGPGRGHEHGCRTPSLWLLPRSNRLALRVSTKERPDFGFDGEETFPIGEWVHMAIVVRNDTDTRLEKGAANGESNDGMFSIGVFQEGERVLHLKVPATDILACEGELMFMNDAWGSNTHAAIRQLRLFTHALDHEEVLDNLEATRDTEPQIELANIFQDPSSRLLPSCTSSSSSTSEIKLNDGELVSANECQDYDLTSSMAGEGMETEELVEIGLANIPRINDMALYRAEVLGHSEAIFTRAVYPWLQTFFRGTGIDASFDASRQVVQPGVMEANIKARLMEDMATAALKGSIEAKLVLAEEWRRKGHCRAALAYYGDVAGRSLTEHTSRGQQTLVEMQVLHDFVEDAGEKGEDDLNVQYYIGQAEMGDTDAMMAVGNWYYWGSHGLARDHDRAYRYFERAADAGNPGGMTACGNMLLKGEGVPEKNLSAAIQRYQDAVEHEDQLAALNGLGYIYFFGHGDIEKNATKALEYFERNLRDGDSLYNAAHIYLHEAELRNVHRAKMYLKRAADDFESLPAAHALGWFWATAATTTDACNEAVHYLRKTALRGSWGRRLRRGFDAFLQENLEASLFHYAIAALMGYSRGAENALWLLGRPLNRLEHVPYYELFQRVAEPMPPLQALLLGEVRQAVSDFHGARKAWVEASVNGNWHEQPNYRAHASYNLAMEAVKLQEYNRAKKFVDRAETFFEAAQSAAGQVEELPQDRAAKFALQLAKWRIWAEERWPLLRGWL